MTEAFNSLLGTHRSQTYLQLLEFIRRMLMRKFQERKEECDAWRTVLTPRVHAKILKHSKASSWQINGIPCPHAMAAISHNCGKEALRDMVPRYVHQSLTKSAYMQTYRGMIHLVPDQKIWPEIEADESFGGSSTQPQRKKSKFKVKFTVNIHHQQLKLQVHSQQERRKPRNNIKHQEEIPKIHPNLNHSHSSLIEEYGLK
ncbi:hypothetical protein Q3G72_033171 [Acer saccharum]|nr:hypothetical protein Q3G72_033171 [Acer saccharum]